MASDLDLKIKVTGDTDQASAAMDRFKKSLGGLKTAIAAVGIGLLAKEMFDATKELEDYNVQFEVLTGSAEKGAKLFNDIREMGAKTPFETKDLAAATKTMLGFGVAQQDILPNLQMLGDIAGGSADKLSSLALVFSQVQSAGKMQGGDLLQMINAGFNPLKVIAEKTGKSMGELRKEMEKGAITADMVADAMKTATSAGGQFFGMMDKQSQTLGGMISTLKDNFTQFLTTIGNALMPLLKVAVDGVGKIIAVLTPIITQLVQYLAPILQKIMPFVEQLLKVLGELVGSVLKALSPVIGVVMKVLESLMPLIVKYIQISAKFYEAIAPLLSALANVVIQLLPVLIPLLDSALNILSALIPLLNLTVPIIAQILTSGVGMIVSVVQPIVDAIKFIVDNGIKAAKFVRDIFGGGGGEQGPKREAYKATDYSDRKNQMKAAADMFGIGRDISEAEFMKMNVSPDAIAQALWGTAFDKVAESGKAEIAKVSKEWTDLQGKIKGEQGTIGGGAPGAGGLTDAQKAAAKKAAEERRKRDEADQAERKLVWDNRKKMEEEMDKDAKEREKAHTDFVVSENARELAAYYQAKREQAAFEIRMNDMLEQLRISTTNSTLDRIDMESRAKVAALDEQLAREQISAEVHAESIKQIDQQTAEARTAFYLGTSSAILDNLGSVFEGSKEIAAASALISTYEGAAAALKIGPWGIPLMIAVLAKGMAMVAKIYATKPGSSGGSSGGGSTSIPSVNMQSARIPSMTTTGGKQVIQLQGNFGFQDGALVLQLQRDVTVENMRTF